MSLTANLSSLAANEFRGSATNQIAQGLDESPAAVQTALSGVLPALVGGMAGKASTKEGASSLLDTLKTGGFDGSQSINVANAVSAPNGVSRLIDTGGPLLSGIFGARSGSVTDWITSLGGIRRGSAASLLSLAAPVVMGLVGQQVKSAGWNVGNLRSLLGAQRNYLQNAPPGLTSALGYDASEVTGTPRTVAPAGTHPRSSPWRWVVPVLALLALLGYFVSRRDRTEVGAARGGEVTAARPTPAPVESVTPAPAQPEPAPAAPSAEPAPSGRDLGAIVSKRLPDGTEIRIPTNGVETKLIAFIEDPNRPADKTTWFSFDRLEFPTGSADLAASSNEQLGNIAAIMKAYPKVQLKLGGYTDNVGNAEQNLKLSKERATNTMTEIVKLGVEPSRVTSEGYGQAHPVASNTTEEGRQQNRRIDILITSK